MRDKLRNVECLRALAALAVTWFHLTNQYSLDAVGQSGRYGWLGVECFFVISGFIIPYSLGVANYRSSQFWRFMARRMVRLEPPYLASIVLVVALAFVSTLAPGFRGEPFRFDPLNLAEHFLYAVPLFHGQWINVVYWTLAYEFVFYIGTGLLFSLLWPRHLAFTVALVLAVAFAAGGLRGLDPLVLLFLMGIATARYGLGRDGRLMFLAVVAGAAGLMGFEHAVPQALVGASTALVLAFVPTPPLKLVSGLAAISYSLYLVHVPIGGRIINLGKRFGDGPLYHLALSLVALAVCLAAAWVFYTLLEAPATAWSKRIRLASGGPALAPAEAPAAP